MQWIAAGLLMNVAVAVIASAQAAGLPTAPRSVASTHSAQSSVTIAGEKLAKITEVAFDDDRKRVRITHEAGVHIAIVEDVPQDFLQSWGILAKRHHALKESGPSSNDYIYSTHQLRLQLRNQARDKVIAAFGPSDFTASTRFTFPKIGHLTLDPSFHFVEVYQNLRIRESTYGPLGSNNDPLAREYNALVLGYIKDSASGIHRVQAVDFGDRNASGLILVRSGRPGGRALHIYTQKAQTYLYRFGYSAVRPQMQVKQLNALIEGPLPAGNAIVLTFDRQRLIPLVLIFEAWEAATEAAAKQKTDSESKVGEVVNSSGTFLFTFRYDAEGRRSVLRVETGPEQERQHAEIPFEALETWKDFFRDSDQILRESQEFWKERG